MSTITKKDRRDDLKQNYRYTIYKILDYNSCIKSLRLNYKNLKNQLENIEVYYDHKENPPKWKKLLLELTSEKEKVEQMNNENWSFVCIIKYGNNHYCFVGGSGFFEIESYIDPNFGIRLCTKLLTPDSIKLLRQKLLASDVIQDERAFKQYNYSYDTQNWNRIPNEILGSVKGEELKKYMTAGFSDNVEVRIEGTASLKINKALSFNCLISLINNIEKLEKSKANFDLSLGFSPSFNNISNLKDELVKQLDADYSRFKRDADTYKDDKVIISYQNPKELLIANNYKIEDNNKSKTVENLNLKEIFQFLGENGQNHFTETIYNNLIVTVYDEENETVFSGKISNFLYGEVKLGNIIYFYIDKIWYKIEESFVSAINKRFATILKNREDGFFMPKWNITGDKLLTEDEYIDSCKSFVVAHKKHIKINDKRNPRSKSELCDLIKIKGDITYLILVKKGLGSGIRELFAQTFTSMTLLAREKKFKVEALKKFLPEIISRKNNFLKKNVAVMAFVDDTTGKRKLQDKLTTIAKLDCLSTFDRLNQLNFLTNYFIFEIDKQS